jgi:hypothetical protein
MIIALALLAWLLVGAVIAPVLGRFCGLSQ